MLLLKNKKKNQKSKVPYDVRYDIDDNIIFGMSKGKVIGLSQNNKAVNRNANVLVIGGSGTGKTFKYVKPNLIQEACSAVATDPSQDIFNSFAPYLISRGYNVWLFNANDFNQSNHFNPLLNVYDSYGNIEETKVDILVSLYLKNAKAGKEAGGSDPFWEKAEQAFLTALIYYVLENDEISMYDKCFNMVLQKVQLAKVGEEEGSTSPLTEELNAWFAKVGITEDNPTANGKYKTKLFYNTFLIAPAKTANTILITTAVDLQIFATKEVDMITRIDEKHKQNNINFDKIATQQSYLFLCIPLAHDAYNFLIAMLYSQLYNRLYELGERKLKGKYHIGYKLGTPVFDYFDSYEEAKEFFETITTDNIVETPYLNGTKVYDLVWKGKSYKTSFVREPIVEHIKNLEEDSVHPLYIWCGKEYGGDDPALPIHVNLYLDEFKNIGEIPNFLNYLSTSRKYRIGSHIIIQDIPQIQTIYKDNEYKTLLANVDTTIFLGSILQEDLEEIQKMLGKTTILVRSKSSSQSGGSTSLQPTQVDLMSIDQISDINNPNKKRDDAIVKVRDLPPFICQKLYLTKHKRYELFSKAKVDIDLKQYYTNQNYKLI